MFTRRNKFCGSPAKPGSESEPEQYRRAAGYLVEFG